MRVYHGGTEEIKQPEASKGRQGLDFGRGFYVTDIQGQAEAWADRMARIRMESGIVLMRAVMPVIRSPMSGCVERYVGTWVPRIQLF